MKTKENPIDWIDNFFVWCYNKSNRGYFVIKSLKNNNLDFCISAELFTNSKPNKNYIAKHGRKKVFGERWNKK